MAAAGALTTSQLRAVWGPPCAVTTGPFTFHTGVQVTVDRRILAACQALDAIMARWRYQPTGPDCGAYVCRQITGGSGYSLHAYGIAIDINWQANPYSAANRLITDMPAGMVNDIEALRTRNGKPVWGWGGHYSNIKDAMHYEIVCTPADLATGINPNTGGLDVLSDSDLMAFGYIVKRCLADAGLTTLSSREKRRNRRLHKRLDELEAKLDAET